MYLCVYIYICICMCICIYIYTYITGAFHLPTAIEFFTALSWSWIYGTPKSDDHLLGEGVETPVFYHTQLICKVPWMDQVYKLYKLCHFERCSKPFSPQVGIGIGYEIILPLNESQKMPHRSTSVKSPMKSMVDSNFQWSYVSKTKLKKGQKSNSYWKLCLTKKEDQK